MRIENDDEYFDLQGFIDSELARGKTKIVIPSNGKNKRYKVKPRNKQHLFLRGLKGIVITAQNVEMICTETTRAITIVNCKDVTIRGLTIDYDPLPFTQGKITGFRNNEDKQKLSHEIELFDGFPTSQYVDGVKYEIYDPKKRCLRYGNYYGISIDKRGNDPKRITVRLPEKYAHDPNFERPERIGDIIAIGCSHAPNGKIPHAICVTNCSRLRMEDVTVYASNMFGFFERSCYASVYLRCRIDRRTRATDPIPRADPRIRSLNADAFHSKHASLGPSIIDCIARFNGDDSVNICGDYHLIASASNWSTADKDNCLFCELRVLAKNNDGNGINIRVGDRVELTTYSGMRLNDVPVVLSVLPDGEITDEELEFLKHQSIDNTIKTKGLKRAFRIQLRAAGSIIPTRTTACNDLPNSRSFYREKLTMGSLIASTNRVGNGFLIEGCHFGQNRSRGILVKGSQGVISRNELCGNWGEAIRVASSYWWLESGNSIEIQIQGNMIRNCRSYGIGVYSIGGDSRSSRDFAPAGVHSDIVVANNKIIRCPLPNILVTSTNGYEVLNNVYEGPLEDISADGPANVKRILDRKDLRELMILNCE
jgi:hypothetical protein